jgi:hypothetical protein
VADTFDDQVISEFSARDGIVGGLQDLSLLLLLHHFGAKSGTERVTPLAFWSVSDNAVVVLASNRGAPTTSGLVLQPGGPPINERGNRGRDVVGSGSGGGARRAPQDDRPIDGGVPVCRLRRGSNLSPDSRRHP